MHFDKLSVKLAEWLIDKTLKKVGRFQDLPTLSLSNKLRFKGHGTKAIYLTVNVMVTLS